MKRIAVFHTGGTIAMEEDKNTGAVKPKKQNPLLQFTPELSDVELVVEDVFQLPSPHMTQKEMSTLQQIIDHKVQSEKIDGVVVTHGTDTLEETAYFLDLTVQANIPIVITGAMRSSNELGADGLPNFISAVRVAASNDAKNAGVLVVLNDEIHAAKNVTKTHTSNIATFQSPQFGPMGIVTKSGVLLHQTLMHREKYSINGISKNVVLLKAYSGMDESIFEALDHIPLHGLVIEALGQGNVPPRTVPAIKKLLNKGIPIVLVSRCFNGVAEDVYGYEGGGKQLRNLGVIFSNGLNGQKARIKLLVALENTNELAEIRHMFIH
ncbi:asparaginase [Priestia taiwanensis]|uniref:asparaginase n=1 Tax=Priestia taiwanensis TaxID=1347902 RepID=A0A917EME5_9BACI|nr:asparaginase [Priestia taiwanensis]MBM7361670.1 L-asparaginase [Priestia taiwanensis]GGE56047.1 L-asparaginase [Priestia taiwanensis]